MKISNISNLSTYFAFLVSILQRVLFGTDLRVASLFLVQVASSTSRDYANLFGGYSAAVV